MIEVMLAPEPANERIESTGSFIVSVNGVKQRRTSYRLQGLRSDVLHSLREFIRQVAERVLENYNDDPSNKSVGELEEAFKNGHVKLEITEGIPESLKDTMPLTISGDSGNQVNLSSLSVDYSKDGAK